MNFIPNIRRGIAFLLTLQVCLFLGCGSGNQAALRGKVLHDGQPVTAGELTFSPLGGEGESGARPATASIQSDGSFAAGTEAAGDGAAAGRYQVAFSPASDWVAPEWDGKGQPPAPPKGQYDGLVPKVAEVEVKPGDNEVVIELVPAASAIAPLARD
jgi:hypothetical protein